MTAGFYRFSAPGGYGDHSFVGSGVCRDAPLSENEQRLAKENAELRRANEILKDALAFFAKDRKK